MHVSLRGFRLVDLSYCFFNWCIDPSSSPDISISVGPIQLSTHIMMGNNTDSYNPMINCNIFRYALITNWDIKLNSRLLEQTSNTIRSRHLAMKGTKAHHLHIRDCFVSLECLQEHVTYLVLFLEGCLRSSSPSNSNFSLYILMTLSSSRTQRHKYHRCKLILHYSNM